MANMETLVQRLEKAVLRLETLQPSGGNEVGSSDGKEKQLFDVKG